MALKLWRIFCDFGIALIVLEIALIFRNSSEFFRNSSDFFRNSSDFFRNSSDFCRNSSELTLWRGLWGPSGNPRNWFENWASETDDMLPDAIPGNTQCQGLTRLSRTWSVYYLCMLPSFWAGHVSVMLIVCMFFSHPYLSLNMLEVAAIG